MTPKDAFHLTVNAYPGGAAALATRLDMSAAVLRNKACPTNTTNVITLDDADRVMALSGDHSVLHALAQAHGFVCVGVEKQGPSDVAVLEAVTEIWSKMGALGTKVHEALADGRLEPRELATIEKAIFDATKPMMQLLARLDGMTEK
jgi:hypothetical protein